jgi:hypothetical protein
LSETPAEPSDPLAVARRVIGLMPALPSMTVPPV